MPDQTPEALAIPKYNPLRRKNCASPYNVVVALNTPKEIYNEDTEQACSTIVMQNQGLGAVLVAFNSPAGPGTYHRVLAAAIAAEDGTGGVTEIDVNAKGVRTISIYSAAAVNVSVEKYQRNLSPDYV